MGATRAVSFILGSSDDVSIQLALSSDTSEIVDGNEALSDCYFASVAGIDGRIFADISDGLSQVYYVDMLLPSTAGYTDIKTSEVPFVLTDEFEFRFQFF